MPCFLFSFLSILQVLTTLSIYGGGSFQRTIRDNIWMHVSQASASRFVRKVTDAINIIAKKYVAFPTRSSDVFDVCNDFYEKFGFPNVIGAIDGTHIDIYRPNRRDFFVYVNRHGRFSINVQMVNIYTFIGKTSFIKIAFFFFFKALYLFFLLLD